MSLHKAWAEAVIEKHGRVNIIMTNYVVINLRDAEQLAFHREHSESLRERGEVKAGGVVIATWGGPK